VRPLLDQPKEVLFNFAKDKKIHFREDVSNASLDFQRNRIRHEAVPLLKKLQPALSETVLRTMEIVAEESSFVLNAATKWLSSKNRKPFFKLHIAAQRMCLRLQLLELKLPVHFDLVEQLRLQPKRIFAVNPKISVYRDATGQVLLQIENTVSFDETEIEIDLTEASEIEFSQQRISWEFKNKNGDSFPRKTDCEWFDARKVGSKIRLRHWKPGDRFQPIGTKTPKKLQDLFSDLKIPRSQRHKLTLATTEQGEIFWIEGLRISERFKLDKTSSQRLKWHWSRLEKPL